MKRGNLVIGIFFISLFLFNFISAEMLTSDAGVEYDSAIVEQFDSGQEFVNVMIDFTNFSDIDSLISDFSEGELKNLLNRNYPYTITPSIAATVSEETFFRLLQDKRVDKIYPNGIVRFDDPIPHKFPLSYLIVIVFSLIMVFIVLFLLINKRLRKKLSRLIRGKR
ncbi:MAG: hypothetical protein PVJ67_02705 [Candidatus Pacearchaeota archaeon]